MATRIATLALASSLAGCAIGDAVVTPDAGGGRGGAPLATGGVPGTGGAATGGQQPGTGGNSTGGAAGGGGTISGTGGLAAAGASGGATPATGGTAQSTGGAGGLAAGTGGNSGAGGTVPLCGGVDLLTDGANCGSCGHACPSGRVCTGGACGCRANQTLCPSGSIGTADECVAVASDSLNCGSCGHACKLNTSIQYGEICQASACVTICDATNDPGGCFIYGTTGGYCTAQPIQAGNDVRWRCIGGVPSTTAGTSIPGATSCTCAFPN